MGEGRTLSDRSPVSGAVMKKLGRAEKLPTPVKLNEPEVLTMTEFSTESGVESIH